MDMCEAGIADGGVCEVTEVVRSGRVWFESMNARNARKRLVFLRW